MLKFLKFSKNFSKITKKYEIQRKFRKKCDKYPKNKKKSKNQEKPVKISEKHEKCGIHGNPEKKHKTLCENCRRLG